MARSLPTFDLRRGGRRILIGVAVLAALNAIFFLLFVQPTVGAYRGLENQQEPFQKLNERRAVVEEHEAFLEALERAEQDLQSLRGEILSTRNERLVEVHAELAALCDRFGIALDAVSYDNQLLLEEELDRHVMNVPLQGNYQSLRKFLQAVETSDKFLVVERVSLVTGKEGGVGLSLTIHLATYFTAPDELVARRRALRRR